MDEALTTFLSPAGPPAHTKPSNMQQKNTAFNVSPSSLRRARTVLLLPQELDRALDAAGDLVNDYVSYRFGECGPAVDAFIDNMTGRWPSLRNEIRLNIGAILDNFGGTRDQAAEAIADYVIYEGAHGITSQGLLQLESELVFEIASAIRLS